MVYYDREQTINYLISKNIKPSLQRIAIMQYMMNHRVHPTVDEVYQALSKEIPTLSKTTVYNTLTLFESAGAVVSITIDEKNVRYDSTTEQHAHLKCRRCGRVFDMKMPVMTDWQSADFEIDKVEILYYGICKECQLKH